MRTHAQSRPKEATVRGCVCACGSMSYRVLEKSPSRPSSLPQVLFACWKVACGQAGLLFVVVVAAPGSVWTSQALVLT